MVACPFCREQIQPGAIKCRHCNERLDGFRPGDQILERRPSKASASTRAQVKRGLLGSLGLAAIGAVVLYFALPRGAKDAVNEVASRSGAVGRVIPWDERAETAVRRLLAGKDGDVIAKNILAITHPTGDGPRLRSFDVRQHGSRLTVRLSTAWKGGFVGTAYRTDVQWEFDENRHVSAAVVADTTAIGAGFARELDQYFATVLHPLILARAGD